MAINLSDNGFSTRKNRLYTILCAVFLTNALLAEIIGVKIFSAESTLGLQPMQIPLLSGALDFNLTAGAIIWPFVFITSDIINEYFGKTGVQRISIVTVLCIAYAFLMITVATKLPPAQFWLDVNKNTGGKADFNINTAFNNIFRQGGGIILGSISAFLLGQVLDVTVFHWLRRKTGPGQIWLRATGSTLVSQLADSFVVLGIAFYVFGNWSWQMVVSVGIINYIYKGAVALLLTPLLYLAHSFIDKWLGPEHAHVLIEEANDYKKDLV
ncbi:MAG: queuosine precursor transporter [Bacteroidota bacterium]